MVFGFVFDVLFGVLVDVYISISDENDLFMFGWCDENVL